jgi:dTDP-4-dehydrorhamnose reductase
MLNMKILITGSSGQLAKELISYINEFQDSNISLISKSSNELNICDKEKVISIINTIKPDVVINCAAYTDVEGCEKNIESAFNVNSLGPRNLAIACEMVNGKLVHISTDYVFNGNGFIHYKEFDLPNPINIYGKTKYLGEEYVKQFCKRYFIIRTSWLYGLYGKNFVKTILNKGKELGELKVVKDQIGSPTSAKELACHIFKIALSDEYGIYHCSNNGQCSWYEFACKIIELSKLQCNIKPVTSDEFKTIAKRPNYSVLDNMMLRSTVGDKMSHWEEALKDFIQKLIWEENRI